MQGASSKERVMSRKTVVVVAMTLVLGGSALSSSAFARGGYGSGREAGGFRGDHFSGAFRDGHAVGGRYAGRVSGLPGGFRRYQHRDVWGHWGAYYGPMISVP